METKETESLPTNVVPSIVIAMAIDGSGRRLGKIIRCCAGFRIQKIMIVRKSKSQKPVFFGSHGSDSHVERVFYQSWEDLLHFAIQNSMHIVRLNNAAASSLETSHVTFQSRFPLCIVVDDTLPIELAPESVSIWFPDASAGNKVPIEAKLSILLYTTLQSQADRLVETEIIGNKFAIGEKLLNVKPSANSVI